jgi:quinol monooxygenase YgiN
MSNQVYWHLEVAILPGKLEDFRAVARDLIASTESEPGTLDYEYNLNADNTVCHIFERYRDSEAMIKHVEGFHRFAERFLKSCRPTRFDVYGNPSEAAKAMLTDLHPSYFNELGGFSR